MSARRIARELAVIMLPQLPRDKTKLDKVEFNQLTTKSVNMLTDYAKQCLADANGLLIKSQNELQDFEVEHVDNVQEIDELRSVTVTTAELRKQSELLERALHLISEAIDMPQMLAQVTPGESSEAREFLFRLVSAYLENKIQIDQYITDIKAKWRIERMVSIDRDIVRLACAEAFYMPDIPIKVAINEAIELTHRFADDRASKFINGILRDLAEQAKETRKKPVTMDDFRALEEDVPASDEESESEEERQPLRKFPF